MFCKTMFYTLMLSLFFSGCASQQQAKAIPAKATASQSDYISQSGYYFVLLQKNEDSWKIVAIDDRPTLQRKNQNQEILRVTQTYSNVYPHFENDLAPARGNTYLCDGSNVSSRYTPCTSNFSATAEEKNLAMIFNNLSKTSPKHKYVSKKAINEAIRDTKLFDAIEEKKESFKYALCQEQFQKAVSVDDFNAFVKNYAAYEKAKELLALALQNLQSLKEQEAKKRELSEASARNYQDLYKKSQEQLEKENLYLAKKEENAMHQHTRSIENFRKGLEVGMQTNCGAIIEMNGLKAKIAVVEKSGVQEHWIERDRLFPKGHGCHFAKGRYIVPPSF